MADIKAADVAKLRKMTGAGMMDCKKALGETNGDFDLAIDILRKKGQKIASNRADREATEGAVLAITSDDNTKGVMICLNCETDFVAKNDDFVAFANSIAEVALANMPETLEDLNGLQLNGVSIADEITNQTGVIGEKVDLSYYAKADGAFVSGYIHPGNKLATMVALSQAVEDVQIAKDVAMQVAAMNPVSVSKDDVPQAVVDKELMIGREQALEEGKPESIVDKIAAGKLNKFFKENTLLSQQFIKDNKITVAEYLSQTDKGLTVTKFYRFSLNV